MFVPGAEEGHTVPANGLPRMRHRPKIEIARGRTLSPHGANVVSRLTREHLVVSDLLLPLLLLVPVPADKPVHLTFKWDASPLNSFAWPEPLCALFVLPTR